MGRSGALPRGSNPFLATPGRPWPSDEGCGILHVDMDAFFASVTLRSHPDLVGRPAIVAGGGTRGVVLSANYPAREFGVHSAMPAARARALCPHAAFLEPEYSAYADVSASVMDLFGRITPLVQPLSLDEAFLDVSGALRRLRTTPSGIAAGIRRRVAETHGVSCSVGVAATKFVAKLSSGVAKPDGMVIVPPQRTLEFLHPLPVSALWGVGEVTAERLRTRGLETVADIAATPLPRLRKLAGVAAAEHLHALAAGHDPRPVAPDAAEKSVGAESTFEYDYEDPALLRKELLRLAGRVGHTLRSRGLRGRTVSIKVRYADFRTITRAHTLGAPTDSTREVYQTAERLLSTAVAPGALRLLGVRVEGLASACADPEQLQLAASEDGWRDAEEATDRANARFGSASVRPASLLGVTARRGSSRHDHG